MGNEMKEIEKEGFVTQEQDVYQRLRKDVNESWVREQKPCNLRCKDCKWGIEQARGIWCRLHEKTFDPDYWCRYGSK